MPCWFRIWMVALLLIISAFPLKAQGLRPNQSVSCPTSEAERTRQCRQADTVIRRNQELIATVGVQMADPMIILARVERASGEAISLYRARVARQQGVATATTNRWLPILGRYFDADRQIVYVALKRQDYWQYVWEKLAPDQALARGTFLQRERESRRFKQARYTGPGGLLARWEREIETAQRFQQACCRISPENARDRDSLGPPETGRP